LWADPADKVARDPWMLNIDYQARALSGLGRVDWNCHSSSPTALVYVNETRQTRTGVAWNPTAQPRTVKFFAGPRLLRQFEAPPYSITSVPLPP